MKCPLRGTFVYFGLAAQPAALCALKSRILDLDDGSQAYLGCHRRC